MGIPGWAVPLIEASWEAEPPMVYGRFDFAYGPDGLKLLEYNADTPTGLLEAAAIQWFWARDHFGGGADQWNMIHEELVGRWRELRDARRLPGEVLHMTHTATERSGEDLVTVGYLAETAKEAGYTVTLLPIEQLGTLPDGGGWVDMSGRSIESIFKLYPWEWLVHEHGWDAISTTMDTGVVGTRPQNPTIWIEPIWKMLWSNKGILPVLWELNEGHPILLPAYFESDPRETIDRLGPNYVRKPLLAREGANTQVVLGGETAEEGPDQEYGEEGFVVQAYTELDDGYGVNPVLGVWTVDMEPVGLGIRESSSLITNNLSRFAPHVLAD
jgi:glutathionylspermidine synthase